MNRGAVLGVIAAVAALVIGAIAAYQWQANQTPPKPVPTAAPPAPQAAAPTPAPAPAAPPPAAAAPVNPSFDVVRVSPSGEAVMAGRADPGAEVTVLDGDKPFATVTADPRGEWVLTPDKPLTPGNHELGLAAKSPQDGTVRKSEGVVVVAVPESNKNLAGEPSQGSQSLAVLVPRQGEGPAKALQVPGNAAAGGRTIFIDTIQYDGAGHLSIGGRAPASGRVLLYLDNKPEGDTRADQKGDWSVKPKDAVPAGQYTLRADLVGQDGKVASRVTLQFRRAEVPAELASNQFLVVQSGDSLWRIARRTLGQGPMFTEIYQANRSDIADPNLIFPGQVVTLPPG